MTDKDVIELRVVRRGRDGRCRYDERGKRLLVEAALRSGVSVARLAQEHGINANLLRKWITKYLLDREAAGLLTPQAVSATDCVLPNTAGIAEGVSVQAPGTFLRKESVQSARPAFVPVVATPAPCADASAATLPASMSVALHVRLPNGVEFDLGEANLEQLGTVVQMFGRMPCSGSMKG